MKEQAQWRDSGLKSLWETSRDSAAGVNAAISAWSAEECNRVFGSGINGRRRDVASGFGERSEGEGTECTEQLNYFYAIQESNAVQIRG